MVHSTSYVYHVRKMQHLHIPDIFPLLSRVCNMKIHYKSDMLISVYYVHNFVG